MAYSDQVKAAVRISYIRGSTLKDAADNNDVPYETVRSWKRKAEASGDDWETARAATRVSAGGVQELTNEIIEDFVHLFKTTIDEIKQSENIPPLKKAEVISRLGDAYQKTVKAAGDSNPKLSRLAVAMDVLQKLGVFIRDGYPQHMEAFIEILEPFGEELSRVFK